MDSFKMIIEFKDCLVKWFVGNSKTFIGAPHDIHIVKGLTRVYNADFYKSEEELDNFLSEMVSGVLKKECLSQKEQILNRAPALKDFKEVVLFWFKRSRESE